MQRELTNATFSYMGSGRCRDDCTTKQKKAGKKQTGIGAPVAVIDYTRQDPVTEDKRWKRAVHDEKRAVSRWKTHWGFLADYTEKGELRETTRLPEYESTFSQTVPNTTGCVYGSRVANPTQPALSIMRLERSLAAPLRKKKLTNELLCY